MCSSEVSKAETGLHWNIRRKRHAVKKVKLPLQQAVKARRVVRRRGSHFPDNRLTDGCEVVSPTRRPPSTPRKIPGTHFCLRLSRPQGHSAAGRIRSIKKSNYHIGNRIRDLPACSLVPQPTTLPRVPIILIYYYYYYYQHHQHYFYYYYYYYYYYNER
jgi:hypothetical protein